MPAQGQGIFCTAKMIGPRKPIPVRNLVFRGPFMPKINWCSSDPVLRASLRTAAGPRPSSGRCSWKVCRAKNNMCSVPLGCHRNLWNWHSVLHRAAGRLNPRSAAPFILVWCAVHNIAIVACPVQKGHWWFEQRNALKFSVRNKRW